MQVIGTRGGDLLLEAGAAAGQLRRRWNARARADPATRVAWLDSVERLELVA